MGTYVILSGARGHYHSCLLTWSFLYSVLPPTPPPPHQSSLLSPQLTQPQPSREEQEPHSNSPRSPLFFHRLVRDLALCPPAPRDLATHQGDRRSSACQQHMRRKAQMAGSAEGRGGGPGRTDSPCRHLCRGHEPT